jgi:hypothetical protein
MHHGDELGEAMRRLAREHGLGATGQHPQGKLDATDEGEIKIAVGTQGGKVVVAFGKPVAWFGLDPAQARALAESLRQKSYVAQNEAAGGAP